MAKPEFNCAGPCPGPRGRIFPRAHQSSYFFFTLEKFLRTTDFVSYSGMTHMGLLVHAHSESRLVFLSPHPFFWCKAPAIKKLNKLDLDRGIVSSFPPLARRVKGFLSPRCVGAAAHRPIFTAYLASRAANNPIVCSLSPCRL